MEIQRTRAQKGDRIFIEDINLRVEIRCKLWLSTCSGKSPPESIDVGDFVPACELFRRS